MNDGGYPKPDVMVDVVLLTIVDGVLSVALLPRASEPFGGREALVGGYIHLDEDKDADATAARVLFQKTGLKDVYAEQLKTFTGPGRDPRGWSVAIAYLALVPHAALTGSAGLVLRPVEGLNGLPFDHDEILAYALYRLRGKGAYSTLPVRLLPREFTLGELQDVYEKVMGVELDPSSFRRKVSELGIVEETGSFEPPSPRKRPGRLYRAAKGPTTFDRRI